MVWSKEHFEEVARVVKNNTEDLDIELMEARREAVEGLCNRFANSFEQKNPKFDKAKFMNACVVEKQLKER